MNSGKQPRIVSSHHRVATILAACVATAALCCGAADSGGGLAASASPVPQAAGTANADDKDQIAFPQANMPAMPSANESTGEAESTADKGKDFWDILNVLATVAAALAAIWSYKSSKNIETTATAQRLSDLWEEMAILKYLSPEQLNQLDSQKVANIVRTNVNTMGKLGFWWNTNLVDRNLMARELVDDYGLLYKQIESLGELAKLNRTGPQLLKENPHAKDLYEALQERAARQAKSKDPAGATQSSTR